MTNEGARHPFRSRLPHHIFKDVSAPKEATPAPRSDDQDWKLFLLSFAAFFTVAYTFIA